MKEKVKQVLKQATVKSLSHEGRGVARVDGKTTFIQGALSGELVMYQLTQKKKDFDQAKVVSVLSPSSDRVEPKCSYYQECGGCSIQHLSHDGQIDFKQGMFLDVLSRVGHVVPEEMVAPILGPVWHYRHKARLSVRHVRKKESVLVGFRERHNPRYITDIDRCRILAPSVGDYISHLKQLFNQFDNLDTIAQIEIAVGDEETALILRNLAPLTENEAQLLISFAKEHQYRLFLQPGNYETVTLFYPQDDKQYLQYRLPKYGITFDFHPTDFTQINSAVNEKMIEQALDWLDLDGSETVLDRFVGWVIFLYH